LVTDIISNGSPRKMPADGPTSVLDPIVWRAASVTAPVRRREPETTLDSADPCCPHRTMPVRRMCPPTNGSTVDILCRKHQVWVADPDTDWNSRGAAMSRVCSRYAHHPEQLGCSLCAARANNPEE
jgi:hypothetical protein